MTEENKVIEFDEDVNDGSIIEPDPETTDELKNAIKEQLEKIQTQNLLLGAQTSCSIILQKIAAWKAQPGKRTLNDHRRILKEIEEFCRTGVSRKVNPDGTTSPRNEDDNTKLTEAVNESSN